jgi:hypothetical protein
MFPTKNGLKQGDDLSPMLFNFALEYATRWVRVSQGGLKFNGTHQVLVYADDVNMLGGAYTPQRKTQKLWLYLVRRLD